MSKTSYWELLRHPSWQKRRLERLNAAEFSCERCGDGETTLHVHHKRYIKGRKPWEYGDDELIVVCEPCHAIQHEEREILEQLLLGLFESAEGIGSMAALIAGYLSSGDVPNKVPRDVIERAQYLDPLRFMSGEVAALASEVGVRAYEKVEKALAEGDRRGED